MPPLKGWPPLLLDEAVHHGAPGSTVPSQLHRLRSQGWPQAPSAVGLDLKPQQFRALVHGYPGFIAFYSYVVHGYPGFIAFYSYEMGKIIGNNYKNAK